MALDDHYLLHEIFLGWSISESIDHVILDFPMIFGVSYTCAITFLLTYNGLLQIHPTHWYDIRYEVSQGVSFCPKMSQVAPSLSQGALKVFQGAPTFFRHILLLQATSSIMVSQVTPGGVSRCIHMCRKNISFQKLNICLGGLNFSVSKCPSFPYPQICKHWCSRHTTPSHDTW